MPSSDSNALTAMYSHCIPACSASARRFLSFDGVPSLQRYFQLLRSDPSCRKKAVDMKLILKAGSLRLHVCLMNLSLNPGDALNDFCSKHDGVVLL